MLILFCLPALAAGATPTPTIWDKARTIMQDVYNKVLGISTIAGIVAASIALWFILIFNCLFSVRGSI